MARRTSHLPMLTVDKVDVECSQRVLTDVTNSKNMLDRRFQALVDFDESITCLVQRGVLQQLTTRVTANGDDNKIAWNRFARVQLHESHGTIFTLHLKEYRQSLQ